MRFLPPLPSMNCYTSVNNQTIGQRENLPEEECFDLDPLVSVFPELSDQRQAEGEVSPNPPILELRSSGEASEFGAREALQNGTAEMAADQPTAGEAREHADGEIREPVPFDIGDDYGPLGGPRECGEEARGVIEAKIVQHHGRQDEIEAARSEGQGTGIALHVPDFREAARASRRATASALRSIATTRNGRPASRPHCTSPRAMSPPPLPTSNTRISPVGTHATSGAKLVTTLRVPRQKRLATASSSSDRRASAGVGPNAGGASRRERLVQEAMTSSRAGLLDTIRE
jgi:hypothetical protein